MTQPSPAPIPVICDRCRAAGRTGQDPFAAFGDLLDFAPVPRAKRRANGWDAEAQRAFIAALSLTGSQRAAARAVGLSDFGVTQLLAKPGSEEFAAAMEEAHAIAAGERSRRLAEGLRAVASDQAGWRPPPAPWAGAATRADAPLPADPQDAARDDETADANFHAIMRTYAIKVGQEREARLAGKIVAADYYLRQLTFIEVLLDLASGGHGFSLLMDFRHRGLHLVDIAETPMSRLLGAVRREKWAEIGDPPRPEHPPTRFLVHQDGFATQPPEFTRGGQPLSHQEQQAIFDQRHIEDAKKQVEWEAEARRDFEARRAAPQPQNPGEPPAAAEGSAGGEQGKAGQPRSSED